jgi:lipoate-protein ligase B
MPPAKRKTAPANRSPRPVYLVKLPRTDYEEARHLQLALVNARGRNVLGKDVILLLEHPPVFTLGRRGGIENLTVSKSLLAEQGIPIVQVERGGNITYHGPGQLVAYLIFNLNRIKMGITDLVTQMEAVMIKTAADFGVQANRNPKNRGIWVGNSKLGSVGIAVRRGISFHGFAFNVRPSLKHFDWINPCGLTGVGVTSLEKELGRRLPMDRVRQVLYHYIQTLFDLQMERITPKELESLLTPIHPRTAAGRSRDTG